jgi:AGCS family alanine or glycine:cation symporter
MTIAFFTLAIIIICSNYQNVPFAFKSIFKYAFNFKSAGGGIFGYATAQAIQKGMSRGIFSNEAGLGSSSIAHASTNETEPVKQGLWGIFEVFVDTILLCTLTALVIIVAILGVNGNIMAFGDNPMMMAIKAYSSVLGSWSEYYMAISVLLFAFATIVCWAHYGKESIVYLTKKKLPITVYVILFSLFVFVGAITAPASAWLAADLALGIMTIINLAVIFLMSDEVKKQTDAFFKF